MGAPQAQVAEIGQFRFTFALVLLLGRTESLQPECLLVSMCVALMCGAVSLGRVCNAQA